MVGRKPKNSNKTKPKIVTSENREELSSPVEKTNLNSVVNESDSVNITKIEIEPKLNSGTKFVLATSHFSTSSRSHITSTKVSIKLFFVYILILLI